MYGKPKAATRSSRSPPHLHPKIVSKKKISQKQPDDQREQEGSIGIAAQGCIHNLSSPAESVSAHLPQAAAGTLQRVILGAGACKPWVVSGYRPSA